jgi:hypothetical protein
VTLTFADFSYTVLIERFDFDLQRVYEIPYLITLVVVTADENASQGPGLHEMVKGDNATAQASAPRSATASSPACWARSTALSARSPTSPRRPRRPSTGCWTRSATSPAG